MYVEMAQAAGKTREATVWTELADRMERAILDGFSDGRQWNPEKFGFFHDPSMSIYADYVGYDVRNDAPAAWYSLCDNTYRSDIDRYIGNAFFGPRGLGYDHNIITQTSMLLDRSDDYDRFLTNLSKLCYSPRLPKPFIVPEGASYSREQGMYRAPRRSRQFRAAERNRPDDPDGGRHFESAGQRRQDHAPAAENMERRSKRPDRSRQRSENQLPGDLSGK